ncbi:hypothetical protein ABPG72_007097 [Tetrahymena utriculariae]
MSQFINLRRIRTNKPINIFRENAIFALTLNRMTTNHFYSIANIKIKSDSKILTLFLNYIFNNQTPNESNNTSIKGNSVKMQYVFIDFKIKREQNNTCKHILFYLGSK